MIYIYNSETIDYLRKNGHLPDQWYLDNKLPIPIKKKSHG